jgi:hypothetical protein
MSIEVTEFINTVTQSYYIQVRGILSLFWLVTADVRVQGNCLFTIYFPSFAMIVHLV